MSLPNEDVPERQREQSGDNDANTQCLTVIDWNVVSCPKEVEAGQAQHPEVGGEEAASGVSFCGTQGRALSLPKMLYI